MFGIAANGMKDAVELDSELVSKHANKMLFVYATMDEWVPSEFMQEYQLRFPALSTVLSLTGTPLGWSPRAHETRWLKFHSGLVAFWLGRV